MWLFYVGIIFPLSTMDTMEYMKYISHRVMFALGLYILFGIIVGTMATIDIANEDLAIGKLCTSQQSCFANNAYVIPASAVIWPIFVLSQPLVGALLIVFLLIVAWLVNRKKPSASSNAAGDK